MRKVRRGGAPEPKNHVRTRGRADNNADGPVGGRVASVGGRRTTGGPWESASSGAGKKGNVDAVLRNTLPDKGLWM